MRKKKKQFVNFLGFSEYFNWRSDYKVVFLDGKIHDVLERPWGFCQICRLMWEQPRPKRVIKGIKLTFG